MHIKESACLAKIIRPIISDVLLRERLFKNIDKLRKRRTIWISAPGGAGKTSLVSSYIKTRSVPCIWYQIDKGDVDLATFFHYLGLAGKNAVPPTEKILPQFTPEYFLGADGFGRYFFTELCTLLDPSCMLIFDNCQEISDDSDLFDTILAGQARMGIHMNIVFISRKDPPPQFSRQIANRDIGNIDWEDLRFTQNEFRELAAQLGLVFEEKYLQQIYSKLDGWAAGLPLLYDANALGLEMGPSINIQEEVPKGTLFNYFANEIIQHLDTESQEILLKTCLLPYIDKTLAEQVCETTKAFPMLQQLYRSNIFISLRSKPGELYQYHQLFREFLLDRSSSILSPEFMNELRSKAALCFIEKGQIEEAAVLLIEANDLPALRNLIIKEAAILLKQGRFQTLRTWLRHIPDSMMNEEPWLLYWNAMCLILQNPAKAMQCFNHALEVFEKRKEHMGLFITMLGMGESLTYGFDSFVAYDQWIEKMETLLSHERPWPSVEIEAKVALIMLTAMAMRQPKHPHVNIWRNQVVTLLESKHGLADDLKIQLLNPLILYSILTGSLPEARMFMDSFKNLTEAPGMPPLVVITLKNFEALYQWRCGNSKECHTAVNEALKLSNETGIYVMIPMLLLNGASGSLIEGNVDLAKEYLDKVERQLDNAGAHIKQLYHISMGWRYLLEKDHAGALVHADKSIKYGSLSGNDEAMSCSYLIYAMALYLAKKSDKVPDLLEQAIACCKKAASPYVEFPCRLFQAYFVLTEEIDRERGLKVLNDALILGRENGYYCFPLWRPEIVGKLCVHALEANIEVEYVRSLIDRRHLNITNPQIMQENWPWPLQIYCFGRFDIVREGKPVESVGKTQQKPLAMLKALISQGGRKVSAYSLAQLLWPDVDGDMQMQSFNTTLYRLRKLLGVKNILTLQSGELTLNNNCCWVDVWRFERMAHDADGRMDITGTISIDLKTAEHALSLYHGAFLNSETAAWAIPTRERLKDKFVSIIENVSKKYFIEEEWTKAIDFYRRGIDSAPLVESFYHQLMLCQKKAGQYSDALNTYQAYKRNLVSSMGISPSQKIHDLYNEIRVSNGIQKKLNKMTGVRINFHD